MFYRTMQVYNQSVPKIVFHSKNSYQLWEIALNILNLILINNDDKMLSKISSEYSLTLSLRLIILKMSLSLKNDGNKF